MRFRDAYHMVWPRALGEIGGERRGHEPETHLT
jgi:hypothetical protein